MKAFTVRQRFEVWAKERGHVFPRRKPGTPYTPPAIEELWQSWSKGYDTGIEDMDSGPVDDGGVIFAEADAERNALKRMQRR